MEKQIVGYKDIEGLEKKIFSISMRFTKKECLDLPDKIHETKYFDLNTREKELYKNIKEQILIELENKQISAPLIITKLIKLNQVCCGFLKTDEGDILNIESSKLKLLSELLSDIQNHKIIIWCNFTASIKSISRLLNSLEVPVGHVCFDGSVPSKDRQGLIHRFQNDRKCRVFIGQIRTGGMGINLTAASYVIYFSNTYSLADRLQSEDRAHRIGQKNSVTYIDLVARKTVEQSIIKALKRKSDFASSIIDNGNMEKIIDGEEVL